MAKLKLPDSLKSWKVQSALPDKNGNKAYSVSGKDSTGSVVTGVMTCVEFSGDEYNDDNIEYVNGEADFIKNVISCGNISNYIDAAVSDKPSKKKLCLYFITDDSSPLSEIMKNKEMSESEIIDFGLQMSGALTTLEEHNIFHGNIKPENIFADKNGSYKLGGFTDFESSIDDFSFAAPEVKNGGQPDYTTDIYSVGLIMYAMCNGGKIPFENNDTDKKSAAEKRLGGEPVTAPEGGSEKLKSVIVIACQPQNENRWKNAGNLKNALSSIKAEDDAAKAPAPEEIIVPASTDFNGNVFEEYVYDDFESDSTGREDTAPVDTAADDAETQQIDADEVKEEATPQENGEQDAPVYKEPDIDNRVFDDYELHTKVFNINEAQKNGAQDYGEFFDEDGASSNDDPPSKPDEDSIDNDFVSNGFYDYDDDYAEEKQSKKGILIIVIAAIIIVALLATIGIVAASNGFFSPGESKDPTNTIATVQPTTAKVESSSQQKETNAEETTVAPTTEGNMAYPTPVLGAEYEYAKSVLEAQGFVVQEGEHALSRYYEKGIVMTMEPDETVLLEKGSTITLYVSDGLIDEESDSEEESENEDSDNNSDNEDAENSDDSDSQQDSDSGSSYSAYKNNTSYMSQSEIDNMSREELNMALNEIYARRGRIFESPRLASYFNSQSWYTPKYTEDEFSANVTFNDYESKNIQAILNAQQEKGYR